MVRQPSLHWYVYGNILAWGPSYRLVRTRLVSRYADCIAWLERAGLTIEGDKTEAIFYSPTARPGTHGLRLATITVLAGEGTQLSVTAPSVNCSDNVRYLG
jgi:hypothetical protein